jgi:hypothetical protein
MHGLAECPVPLASPCTMYPNTLVTTFRASHLANAAAIASGAHVTIDPTPFLSAIVTVSVALVAIVGGLLIARFVSLDSDQRTSRTILTGARERLRLAQGREQEAWRAILRWDAGSFFARPQVIEAVVDQGVRSSAELMRMADWSHDPDELTPFVAEVAEEVGRARDAISARMRSGDVFWGDFRRRTGLSEVPWPWVWAHVFDDVARERDAKEKEEVEARRRAAPPKSAMERAMDEMSEAASNIQRQRDLMTRLAVPLPQTDSAATAARRSDELDR